MSHTDSQIVEVFLSLRADTGASVDSVLTNPTLRARFLERVRQEVGEVDEEPVLKCIINARKRSRIGRR
jgi:hypothetical protein